MPNPTLTCQANNVVANTETNAGKITLPVAANGKFVLTFNRLRATSTTGCVDFIITIYKNGIPGFPQRTGLNEAFMDLPIDYVLEFSGILLVTVQQFDPIAVNHGFIITLETI